LKFNFCFHREKAKIDFIYHSFQFYVKTSLNFYMNITIIANILDALLRSFSLILFISSFFQDSLFFNNQVFEVLNFIFLLIYTAIDILCIAFFILEFNLVYNSIFMIYTAPHEYTSLSTFLIDHYFSKKVPFIKFLISVYFFFIFIEMAQDNFKVCFKYNMQMCVSIGIIIIANFVTYLIFNLVDFTMLLFMSQRSPKIHIKEPKGVICSICIDEQEEQKQKSWIQVKCQHKFHETCINEWLKVSNTCPNCRIKV
jgi:Ring finger domain